MYTEIEIWQLTPRQLKAQMDVHMYVKQQMNKSGDSNEQQMQTGYIDQLKGW